LRVAGEALSDTAALLAATAGGDSQRENLVRRGPGTGRDDRGSEITARLEELEQLRGRSLAELGDLAEVGNRSGSPPGPDGAGRQVSGAGREVSDTERYRETVDISFHARAIAVGARTAAADALVATRRAPPETLEELRRSWFGVSPDAATSSHPKFAGLASGARVVARHLNLRSVAFHNAARGAVALSAAVAIADLADVRNGFWVVLGTLSVLRTNAASTGATALRALLGTVAGFAVGGALILGIGTSVAGLWAALPVAVLVAAYAPGAAPFAVGQAGFTVVVAVLYNLLTPIGWKVGELRVEDVAIGCGVSMVVGLLFWPRGAGVAVSGDLADAFYRGDDYLRQATAWALGFRPQRPNTGPAAVAAASELEDGLRQFLTEQGAKRVSKQDLWRLVGGATRLRLAAHSLEGVPFSEGGDDPAGATLDEHADGLTGWYDAFARSLQRGEDPAAHDKPHHWDWSVSAAVPRDRLVRLLWIAHHLRYLDAHRAELLGPAARLAEERQRAWWH
jgi:uncharacterized membrane protein YccC